MCILCIWILSVGCGFVPFSIWMSARKMNRFVLSQETGWPSCTISLYWFQQFKAYAVFGYAVFFYVPFALILVFSISVAVVMQLRRRQRSIGYATSIGVYPRGAEALRQRKEKQAIVQLMLIVGSFLIGYIPHTAYHIYATTTKAITHHDEVVHWWFGMSEYMLLRLSECLNPIFYNLASSSMRKETKSVLSRACRCRKSRDRDESSKQVKVFALTSSTPDQAKSAA
uniref:Growth hormone secretagogue receptor type 1-like n=1 Tax=Phallusia mammillata TaxID=59560 RepID=A0A6F9DD14_9ASCI|nr:growth hormone secretagogue receptor type 1-like [Phallusia mammillata]